MNASKIKIGGLYKFTDKNYEIALWDSNDDSFLGTIVYLITSDDVFFVYGVEYTYGNYNFEFPFKILLPNGKMGLAGISDKIDFIEIKDGVDSKEEV
jgi:hypothetical protein